MVQLIGGFRKWLCMMRKQVRVLVCDERHRYQASYSFPVSAPLALGIGSGSLMFYSIQIWWRQCTTSLDGWVECEFVVIYGMQCATDAMRLRLRFDINN